MNLEFVLSSVGAGTQMGFDPVVLLGILIIAMMSLITWKGDNAAKLWTSKANHKVHKPTERARGSHY